MSAAKNANILSPKLLSTPRTNLDSWIPYYAGFSGDFVKSLINHSRSIKGEDNLVVFDPWAGVGTTLYIASSEGYESFGGDVNPFAVDVARSKSHTILKFTDELDSIFGELFEGQFIQDINRDILEYFDLESTLRICGVLHAINTYKWPDEEIIDGNIYSPLKSLFKSSLITVCQKYSKKQKTSNPTWSKVGTGASLPKEFYNEIRDLIVNRVEDLNREYHDKAPANFYTIQRDARLSCNSRKFDVVITSPPYLTRIDYAINTKFAISFYEDYKNFRFLRESSTGSPVIRNDSDFSENWGPYTKKIDSLIKNHHSKASGTYYIKIYRQYVKDIYESFQNMASSASPNAIGYIVVQSSYYKEIKIELREIVMEAASASGFNSSLLASAGVSNTMASVNTNSFKYESNKNYTEDTIYITI